MNFRVLNLVISSKFKVLFMSPFIPMKSCPTSKSKVLSPFISTKSCPMHEFKVLSPYM